MVQSGDLDAGSWGDPTFPFAASVPAIDEKTQLLFEKAMQILRNGKLSTVAEISLETFTDLAACRAVLPVADDASTRLGIGINQGGL